MPKKSTPLEVRFWSRVKKTKNCWLWTGNLSSNKGYGRISIDRSHSIFAHRFSFFLRFGTVPQEKWVLHKCDNPACVRPSHLFLGEPRDNTQDMIRKGRASWQKYPGLNIEWGRSSHKHFGENSGTAKLTKRQAQKILSVRYKCRAEDLAEQYDTAVSNVYAIWSRRSWQSLGA